MPNNSLRRIFSNATQVFRTHTLPRKVGLRFAADVLDARDGRGSGLGPKNISVIAERSSTGITFVSYEIQSHPTAGGFAFFGPYDVSGLMAMLRLSTPPHARNQRLAASLRPWLRQGGYAVLGSFFAVARGHSREGFPCFSFAVSSFRAVFVFVVVE